MEKSISVVVPVFNQAAYVGACLDAVWFQEYPEVELVVVDDGSSDGTAAVLDDFERGLAEDRADYAADLCPETGEVKRAVHPRYPREGRRLVRLAHERNRGLGAALNTGFAAADGELVTYIASDDLLLPSMCSELARAMDEAGADFAYADMHVVTDQGRIMRRFSLPDYDFAACFRHWYFLGVCKLYKRELHQRFGYYREELLAHDHELYLRFALGGAKMVHVPKVLAQVRHHGPERSVVNHAPESWKRLMGESADLVRLARASEPDADFG